MYRHRRKVRDAKRALALVLVRLLRTLHAHTTSWQLTNTITTTPTPHHRATIDPPFDPPRATATATTWEIEIRVFLISIRSVVD